MDVVILLGIFGALLAFVCFVWLNIRTIKDGAAPDIVLLLTGISLIAYCFTRWDRAKYPLLGTVGGFALIVLAAGMK